MTKEFIDFVHSHLNEDTSRLMLSAARYPAIDMAAAVQQIEGLRTAREKWPTLAQCRDYLYPKRLNREQSSSEETARFKRRILLQRMKSCDRHPIVADLTGGMGIDTVALAGGFDTTFRHFQTKVEYVECDPALCSLMEHNSKALNLPQINIHCADSMEWIAQCGYYFDLIFIDPARRDIHGNKVAAFDNCTPNILPLIGTMLSRCDLLMIKASPMMEIDKGVSQLLKVSEIHVVAVKGECKELLFLCEKDSNEPVIHCHNIISGGTGHSHISFTRNQETMSVCSYCDDVGTYLFEPDASLMKGGPFKLLCSLYGVHKLSKNSNLYTSDNLREWPGRIFRVLQETTLTKKSIAKAIPSGKAHVLARNFPAEAAELQRHLGLREEIEAHV